MMEDSLYRKLAREDVRREVKRLFLLEVITAVSMPVGITEQRGGPREYKR